MAGVAPAALSTLLGMIQARPTAENLRFAGDWQQAEGGSAAFNPFNTTQPAPGASSYNSNGGNPVKNYPTLQSGLTATAQTLLNGHYGRLVSDLRSGNASASQLAQDVATSPWGTGSLVEKVVAHDGGSPAILGAKNAVGSAIGALSGAHSGGASMGTARDALLNMVLGSSQSIASGQGPGLQSPEQLLQLLSAVKAGNGAPATSGVSQGATAAPGGAGRTLASASSSSVVNAAHQFLGVPYQWGGNNAKTGLDCSSFIQQTFAKVGVNLPRVTTDQFKTGQAVNLAQLKPGDAVFTEPGQGPSGGPGHVGLYIGNGQIQESPHTGTVNSVIPLKDFLGGGFVGARRYVA